MLHWILTICWPPIGQAVSAHLHTNHWWDWAQTCEMNTYGTPQAWLTFGHTSLNCHHFLASLWLVEQSLAFAKKKNQKKTQTDHWWDWVQTWWMNWYETPRQAWLTFGRAPLNFHHLLAFDWSSSFCTFANHWWDWAQTWWVNSYGIPQALLTFGHAPLNSHCFFASDLLSSSCAFANKGLIKLSSNLVGEIIVFPLYLAKQDLCLSPLHYHYSLPPLHNSPGKFLVQIPGMVVTTGYELSWENHVRGHLYLMEDMYPVNSNSNLFPADQSTTLTLSSTHYTSESRVKWIPLFFTLLETLNSLWLGDSMYMVLMRMGTTQELWVLWYVYGINEIEYVLIPGICFHSEIAFSF